MNTKLIKNFLISGSVAIFASSCGATGADATGLDGVTKAVGDAAVDAATKNVDPLTGAAVRNATGFGTDPIEKASTGLLNQIGL